MLDDVGPVVADVLTEKPTDDGVVGLDSTMAALNPIPADHDQIGPYVIPGMFAHVMEGEAPNVPADDTLPPLEVQVAQQECVAYARNRLGIDQAPRHPQPSQPP